jgi:uncharacterized Ntn-hydrolase superfamily protein
MTYSIVARDPATGELGVAVQSHWFSVGSVVIWARAGVGAVATQAFAEPAYGPRLLERLASGEAPRAALEALVDDDERRRFRQVAVIGAGGDTAAHTGEACIQHTGGIEGEGFSVQANMMASPEVWPAMADAYRAAEGPLARRLLSALRAGEAAGGDVRGKQSAALLVVPAEGDPWATVADIRVDDHPEPLDELARLLDTSEAYDLLDEAEDLGTSGRHEEAGARFIRAMELSPNNPELLFWGGLGLAQQDADAGTALVQRAIQVHGGWRDLLARLDPEIAPGAEPVRAQLGVEPAA